jgi:colanic acid biosynthesis glycosyl transferase WcaI
MRILILAHNYYPELIGIAPLVTELAESLVQEGHEVQVVTAMPNYPERSIYLPYRGRLACIESRAGVRLIRHWVFIRPQPGLITRLTFELSNLCLSTLFSLQQPKADVILAVSPQLSSSLTAHLLQKLWGCPVVLNVQDLLPDAAIASGLLKNSILIAVSRWLEMFAYGKANAIVLISGQFVRSLVEKGIPAEKLWKIYNWVDTAFIRPMERQGPFREKLGLKDEFVVMYSGNIALTQGLETMIEAAKILQKHEDIRFVIVGEQKALDRLQVLITGYGLHNVRLLPFQPRTQLPQMLAAADVGLILQKEHVVDINMPSKTMVLMASGRPVIASVNHRGEVARAIEQSGAGVVVTPEDPQSLAQTILQLKANPDLAQVYGEKARAYACAHFDRCQSVKEYTQVFSAVLKDEPQPLAGAANPVVSSLPTGNKEANR